MIPVAYSEIGQPEGGDCLGVFVNADSKAELIYQGYGGFEGELAYDGFTHLFILGGMNNASLRTEIFSIKDGKFVKEYSYPYLMKTDSKIILVNDLEIDAFTRRNKLLLDFRFNL